MKKNLLCTKSGSFASILGFLLFIASFNVRAQYTLTDNDVVVTDGVITSCSYNFAVKNIIIPQTLDGQIVIGIANATYSSAGIFYYKGITSVQFPATLKTIGNYAFYFNSIGALDLSNCQSLSSIGEYSFYMNSITTLNLTNCKSLLYIGANAFGGNSLIAGFALPVVTYKGNVYTTWQDATGKNYSAGVNKATDLSTSYLPVIPYTFSDDDVVVESGIIKSCSYNFELKNIIIPQTLDGQTVSAIAGGSYSSAGVFYNKKIITLQLPVTIQIIGDYAFYDNDISKLNFTGYHALTTVGKNSFYSNELTSVDLSDCPALTIIDSYAFYYNKIATLNLSGCTALTSVMESAFSSNRLTTLDLSPCISLTTIGRNAFYLNSLTSVNISGCKSLLFISPGAFSATTLKGFTLPQVVYKGTTYNIWNDGTGKSYTAGVDQVTVYNTSYFPVILYTLTDEDVVVESGIIKSCSYNFVLKNIIIPQTLDGQTVTGIAGGSYSGAGVFNNKDIVSLQLPAGLQTIGDYAFYDNPLTKLNFSDCKALTSIGNYSFYSCELSSLDLSPCKALASIGNYAFYSNLIASLNLTGCSALTSLGTYAFYSNRLPAVDLSACKSLRLIGSSAFYNNLIKSVNITGCSSLLNIGSGAFSANATLTGFVLPEVTFKGTVYKIWQDGTGKGYTTGTDQVTNFGTFLYPLIYYTLTNDDAVVEKGMIKSCSYNFELRNIIIPPALDGQTVTGIADGTYSSAGVFYMKGIISLELPSTLQTIGDYAFYDNTMIKLNLSVCKSLTSIGKYAFYSCDLTGLDLSDCITLSGIGDYAFNSNKITSLNLSACKSLTKIGKYAFASNSLSGFALPDPVQSGYILNQWMDDTGGIYYAGAQTTNFSTGYTAKMTQFYRNSFFAFVLTGSQDFDIKMNFKCPPRGFEVTGMTFDNARFSLKSATPITVSSGDSTFFLQFMLKNPETKLFLTKFSLTYKTDGLTKTYSGDIQVAALIESNTELGVVGKRAIAAYNASVDVNPVATLNNQGVIYRLLGYADLAKPVFDNAVSMALSKFYAFTGIKMNQGVIESDKENPAAASIIYENALNDIGNKKDSSVLAPQIFYNQAWDQYVSNNFAGAETSALKTLNHKKANAWLKAKAAALLGAIKYNRGDKEGAVSAFQTASSIDGNGPIGAMARENLQLITASGDLSFPEVFRVYPQPATDYLIIEFTGKSYPELNIELSDLSGKVILSEKSLPSGSGSFHIIDLKGLPAGIYHLNLLSKGFRQVSKIIIQ